MGSIMQKVMVHAQSTKMLMQSEHVFTLLYICILSHIVITLSLSFFRLCAACQCLKHFIVFSTLVTF
jgi:hypothetical protein